MFRKIQLFFKWKAETILIASFDENLHLFCRILHNFGQMMTKKYLIKIPAGLRAFPFII